MNYYKEGGMVWILFGLEDLLESYTIESNLSIYLLYLHLPILLTLDQFL